MDPVTLTPENTSAKVLDHHGLVMAIIQDLGIIEKIDELLPSADHAKTTHGQRLAAMILNGLGFIDTRLYMFSHFFDNKPVERLLGEELNAEHFNDDALGRTLDAIYEYGVSKLFGTLALSIGKQEKLLGRSVHGDTTSLKVYGNYELDDDPDAIDVTYGYSKDHRPDLKQVMLYLATTGAGGFPLWMQPLSGNSADSKVLMECSNRLREFCEGLEEAPDFLHVGDGAFYGSCLEAPDSMRWLTRVPESYKWAKELIGCPEEELEWVDLSDGYRICVLDGDYKGVKQRICLVYSEQAYKRGQKSLEKSRKAEREKQEKELRGLEKEEFGSEKDAWKALNKINKKMKYHKAEGKLEEVKRHDGKGRPKKGAEPKVVGYRLVCSLKEEEEKWEAASRRKGRFILSTNELNKEELKDEEMLKVYKEQSKTEKSFRFIKGDTLELSSIYLKKPSRIEALLMVMACSLLVFGVGEHRLRVEIEKAEDEGGHKLLSKKVGLLTVFKLFEGVHELTVKVEGRSHRMVINYNDFRRIVIDFFGVSAKRVYGLS